MLGDWLMKWQTPWLSQEWKWKYLSFFPLCIFCFFFLFFVPGWYIVLIPSFFVLLSSFVFIDFRSCSLSLVPVTDKRN